LKPENILLFSNNKTLQTAWCISDFGTAQIHEIVSSGSIKPDGTFQVKGDKHGDPEYGAPDVAYQGWSSRPYDIWSLGCIFLEILVWIFGTGPSEVLGFQTQRFVTSEPRKPQNTAFWYQDSQDQCRLKPKVAEKLKELRPKCEQRGVFLRIWQLTAAILTIKPDERPNAPTVHNDLDAILRQATYELGLDPDCYVKPQRTSREEIAKPPTAIRADDREGSIDERTVPVRMPTPDTPSQLRFDTMPRHRRMSSDLTTPRSPGNGDYEYVGQHLSPTESNHAPPESRSRSPSISISRPNGETFDHRSDTDTEASLPMAWRAPTTFEDI